MSIRQFELLEDLHPEQKASAMLLRWDGQAYVRSKEKIVVHDFVRTHGDRDDRGYCFLNPDSNLWECISGLFQQIPDHEF